MELKKNPRYNLEKKSPLFFAIGLVVALSFALAAFEWKAEYDGLVLRPAKDHFPPPIDIPITIIDAPKPPKPVAKVEQKPVSLDRIKIVDEIEEELKKVIDPVPIDDFGNIEIPEPPVDPEDNTVYFGGVVESAVSFPGGWEAFYRYVKEEIEYPRRAKDRGIEGKVFVQFVINQDGSVSEVEVIKGIGGGCDEEAKRVIENAPRFNPGKQRGRPVRVRMVLPIVFKYGTF